MSDPRTSAPDDYVPIDCGLYDGLELLCLRRRRLRLTLVDGSALDGRARTLRALAGDGEYLVIECGDEKRALRLDRIVSLEPLDANGPAETLVLRRDPDGGQAPHDG